MEIRLLLLGWIDLAMHWASFAQQDYVENFYTEFYKNPLNMENVGGCL
jgi:hypothetical protein